MSVRCPSRRCSAISRSCIGERGLSPGCAASPARRLPAEGGGCPPRPAWRAPCAPSEAGEGRLHSKSQCPRRLECIVCKCVGRPKAADLIKHCTSDTGSPVRPIGDVSRSALPPCRSRAGERRPPRTPHAHYVGRGGQVRKARCSGAFCPCVAGPSGPQRSCRAYAGDQPILSGCRGSVGHPAAREASRGEVRDPWSRRQALAYGRVDRSVP